jgi:hypothetical protein
MPASLQRPLHWPESGFYVSERHKFVYCPIQKIACSSLKLLWAELVDGSSAPFVTINEAGQESIDHFGLDVRYSLGHQPPELGERPLNEEGWLRVVFVRNPWARLVSTFVNKFVSVHDRAEQVFDAVHRRERRKAIGRLAMSVARQLRHHGGSPAGLGRKPIRFWSRERHRWRDEMTFRQFVEFLEGCDVDGKRTDLHWRPQYRFLGRTEFNFVGRFERLQQDVGRLVMPLPAANRTPYCGIYHRIFADCPLKRLRRMPSAPDYRQFYTPELRDRVARLYRRDIEQFGYEFDN